jgi:hypothetical protein
MAVAFIFMTDLKRSSSNREELIGYIFLIEQHSSEVPVAGEVYEWNETYLSLSEVRFETQEAARPLTVLENAHISPM